MEAAPQHPEDQTDVLHNYCFGNEQLAHISECPQIQFMDMFLTVSSPLSMNVSYSC